MADSFSSSLFVCFVAFFFHFLSVSLSGLSPSHTFSHRERDAENLLNTREQRQVEKYWWLLSLCVTVYACVGRDIGKVSSHIFTFVTSTSLGEELQKNRGVVLVLSPPQII